MYRRSIAVTVCSASLAATSAWAAEEKGGDKAEEAAPATATETQETPFVIRRGFYAESDLGAFFTFGGYNTNLPELPAKGLSNVQPYLGLVLGYDIMSKPKTNLSLGLKLAAGFSSGAGRPSADQLANVDVATTIPNDFAVYEAGLAVAFGYFVSERVALTLKVDGGAAIVTPDTTIAAAEPGAGGTAVGGMAGGGLGVEYFTLLNDFSVGLDLRFAAIFHGGMIPSASISVPIRYTF
jgi:hypothetical protein